MTDDLVGIWKRDKDAALPAWPPVTSDISISTGYGVPALPVELLAFDAGIWGDDRANVLASFAGDNPSRVALARGPEGKLRGCAIMQSSGGILGPWVASDPDAARALLSWALGLADVRPEVAYLPSGNTDGADILSAAGFARMRQLAHMRRGAQLPGSRLHIYSQANLALG